MNFSVYCLPFCFEFDQNTQNKGSENISVYKENEWFRWFFLFSFLAWISVNPLLTNPAPTLRAYIYIYFFFFSLVKSFNETRKNVQSFQM